MEFEKPQYSMTFDDEQGQVVESSTQDLAALTKKVLHSFNPAPEVEDLPDFTVQLPAGLIVDGELFQTAEVRELTGEDEEKLAKARAANNASKIISTLIQCGTVSVGDSKATEKVLNSLLQGDLDTLLLGIRRVTFGDEFEVFNIQCSECGEANDVKMKLSDIPMKTLDDPEKRVFTVSLRQGRKATLTLPTGALQLELFKKQYTLAEMNSITLASCVQTFIEANGEEHPCSGLADVKKLGLADRKSLQDFIYNTQPGPRYDEVVAACHACEAEVLVPLSVGLLFRDI
jgi:hypothetical protein